MHAVPVIVRRGYAAVKVQLRITKRTHAVEAMRQIGVPEGELSPPGQSAFDTARKLWIRKVRAIRAKRDEEAEKLVNGLYHLIAAWRCKGCSGFKWRYDDTYCNAVCALRNTSLNMADRINGTRGPGGRMLGRDAERRRRLKISQALKGRKNAAGRGKHQVARSLESGLPPLPKSDYPVAAESGRAPSPSQ